MNNGVVVIGAILIALSLSLPSKEIPPTDNFPIGTRVNLKDEGSTFSVLYYSEKNDFPLPYILVAKSETIYTFKDTIGSTIRIPIYSIKQFKQIPVGKKS